MSSMIRVLHLTDLHIMAEAGHTIYGTDPRISLRAVLDEALAADEAPDCIVATGDLSEDGSPMSYRSLRQILLDTGLPVFALPGNHDVRDVLLRDLVGGPIQAGPTVALGAWQLILLDSVVRGAAHGFLEPDQFEVLSSALRNHPATWFLIALHHGPVSPCPSSGCQLKNREQLLELLDAHSRIRGVLAGHAHAALDQLRRDARLLTSPSTCSQGIHAQSGEVPDHEIFWTSHRFDPSRHGFRMVVLHADGHLDTQVHWVQAGPVKGATGRDSGPEPPAH